MSGCARKPPRTELVTLLFTDIVGSTALKQQLGYQAGAALLRQHPALVRELFQTLADAEAKAERLIAQGPRRLNREEPDLQEHPKSHPLNLALTARLRRETTLTLRQIARRLRLGSWQSLNDKLCLRNKTAAKAPGK